MSYVDVTVRVNTADHSFVSSPSEARAVVENILRRDPRFRTNGMTVLLRNDGTSTNTDFVHEDEHAGENLHNVFKDAMHRSTERP